MHSRQCFPREIIFYNISLFSPVSLQMELYIFSLIFIFINFLDQVRNTSSILVRYRTRNRWVFEWSKASSECLMTSCNLLKFKSTFNVINFLCDILKATFQLRSRLRNLFISIANALLLTNAYWLCIFEYWC